MALYSVKKLNFSLSNRLRRSLLVFTGFFILFTFIQFGIASYQRHAALRDKLVRWSDEIAEELKYSNKWDLASFRNSDYNANHYYVLDRNGLIITIGGFVPDLQLRVSLKEQRPGIRTVT